MATVSIITATFNLHLAGRWETFKRAVASVRAQSHPEIEHIVMDGGSSDGTADDIAAMGGFARVISEPDRGVYDAMNKGASLATGEWLFVMNSDDYLHEPEGLAKSVALAKARDVDFTVSPVRGMGPEGEITTGVFKGSVSRGYARVLLTMPFGHSGMLLSRRLFMDLGGFDLSYKITADYDLILRLFLARATSAILPKQFVTYQVGGLSSDAATVDAEKAAIWRKHFGHLVDLPDAAWLDGIKAKRVPRALAWALLTRRDTPPVLRRSALVQWLRSIGKRGA